jgi:hypothetical protein
MIAFTDAGYVAAGYAVTSVVLVGYVVRLLQRARAAGRAVPPEERRWR